jgi:hypothetical protein
MQACSTAQEAALFYLLTLIFGLILLSLVLYTYLASALSVTPHYLSSASLPHILVQNRS